MVQYCVSSTQLPGVLVTDIEVVAWQVTRLTSYQLLSYFMSLKSRQYLHARRLLPLWSDFAIQPGQRFCILLVQLLLVI